MVETRGRKPKFERLISFAIDEDLYEKIDTFRHLLRFKAEAEACRSLLAFALEMIEGGEPPPTPAEELERIAQIREAKPLKGIPKKERKTKRAKTLGEREAEIKTLTYGRDEDD